MNVCTFQLHKENLVGKMVHIENINNETNSSISDKDIKIIQKNNSRKNERNITLA